MEGIGPKPKLIPNSSEDWSNFPICHTFCSWPNAGSVVAAAIHVSAATSINAKSVLRINFIPSGKNMCFEGHLASDLNLFFLLTLELLVSGVGFGGQIALAEVRVNVSQNIVERGVGR
jgi:hypothetical protein